MKLKVKMVDAPAVAGGKAIALCDGDGNILPMQAGCTLDQNVGEISMLTVRFHVDGEQIVMDGGEG